jgi:hypothetical protein
MASWARRAVDGVEPEVGRWGVGARVVQRATRRYDAEDKRVRATEEDRWSDGDVPAPFDLVATVALDNGSTIEVR